MSRRAGLLLLLAWIGLIGCPGAPVQAIEPATPEQQAEIQLKIDQGTSLLNLWKKTVKEADQETDPEKHRRLIALAYKLDRMQRKARQEAIVLIDRYYHLAEEGKGSKGEPQYDDSLRSEGTTLPNGKVKIGERAFRSLEVLLSTKLHEFTHADDAAWDRWPEDEKSHIMAELKAYQRELDLAAQTGLSEEDQEDVRQRMEQYKTGLSPTNLQRANEHIYEAEAISLKNAVEYGYAKVELEGCGRASGTVFLARIQRLTRQPFVLEIAQGTPLAPNRAGVQTMMVARDVFVRLDGPQASAEIPGYCLEPEKAPPPAPTSSDRGPTWTALNRLETPAHLEASRIILRGQALSREGRYHKDMPSEKQRNTVIQRSLWNLASPEGFDRARLLKDIREQVAEAGGSQTPAQIEELCDHLWKDVELTRKGP